MSKQLKDYLPYYLGCEVGLKTTYRPNRYKLVCIWHNGTVGTYKNGETFPVEVFNIEYVQPILRPLSDWSLRESSEYGVDIAEMRSVIELGIYEPKLFHYLLSKHFDLFGLIEAGLAIDKTKQTQSHE